MVFRNSISEYIHTMSMSAIHDIVHAYFIKRNDSYKIIKDLFFNIYPQLYICFISRHYMLYMYV